MPTVCVYRPNRSEARPFTARDAARVAKYAARRHGAISVAAAVIASLELSEAVCILDCCAAAQQDKEDIGRELRKVIDKLKQLQKSPFLKHPIARAAIVVVIGGISAAIGMSGGSQMEPGVDCESRTVDHEFLCSQIEQWKTELNNGS